MTNEQENLQEEELLVEEISNTETESNDQEQEESTQDDSVTLSKSEYTKLKRQAIAYKSQKENQPAPLKEKNGSPDINRDELYLVAKGYDDDALEQLRIIARGSGISLKDALNNPLFKTYEANQKNEERKSKAKLGASSGSGFSQGGPAIKPNMTQDEHMAIWSKMSGK